jgi:hypothetical protein
LVAAAEEEGSRHGKEEGREKSEGVVAPSLWERWRVLSGLLGFKAQGRGSKQDSGPNCWLLLY